MKHSTQRICGDCIHYSACSSWNVGSLLNTDARSCVNYEVHDYNVELSMTTKEYNNNIYPVIQKASYAISAMDIAIQHMDVDKNEVKRQLELHGFDDESKNMLSTALSFYKKQIIKNIKNN